MSSEIKVNSIKDTSNNEALTISSGNVSFNNTISAGTLGSSVVVPASIGGSMHLINKQTASNDSLIEFTNLGNHSAFTNLFFVFNDVRPTQDNVTFRSRVAISGTSYQSSYYSLISRYIERNIGSGSTGGPGISQHSNTMFIALGNCGNHADDDTGISGHATIYHHQHSTNFKRILWDFGYVTNSQNGSHVSGTATYSVALPANRGPLTAIKFEYSSNTIASGSIAMYGIKDA